LYVIAAQNLYIQKVCQVNLNISEEICRNLTHHKEEQAEVQGDVAVLQGVNQVLQAIPSVIFAVFAGPWSDIYGRRLLIICATFGYIFNNGVFIINTIWFHELSAEYLLFECLQDCTGGYVCFFLACYAYIADISTKEERTKRLAFCDGLFPAGFFTGMALSAPIQNYIGFIGNFGLGTLMAVITLMYAIFFVKDSRKLRPKEVQDQLDMMKSYQINTNKKDGLRKIFDVENVKQGFNTMFKRRDNNVRRFIIMLACCFVLEIFLTNGKGPIQYLYFRRKFSWDHSKFGGYIAVFGIVGIFAQFVVIPFLSGRMGLHDTTLGVIAILTCIAQQIIVCFTPAGAEYEWLIYFAGIIAFLSITITTTTRSLVTKCVGPMEVGKVFSVMGAFQAMVPLVAGPLYSFIYKKTLKTFPGAFLLFGAALYIVVLCLLISVYLGMKKNGILKESRDQTEFVPTQMEKLLKDKNETKPTKIVVELAPEGDRFNEVAVHKERHYK